MINELNSTKDESAKTADMQAEHQAVREDNAAELSDCAAEGGTAGQDVRKTGDISGTGEEALDTGATAEPEYKYQRQSSSYREGMEDDLGMDEERRSRKHFWRFRSGNDEESRDKLILSRIRDEDLMEYLTLEQRRVEFLQQAKEAKEKRLLNAFQLLVTLAAIVVLTYLLQDNPTILISILYVAGIVAVLKVWRNPQDNTRLR